MATTAHRTRPGRHYRTVTPTQTGSAALGAAVVLYDALTSALMFRDYRRLNGSPPPPGDRLRWLLPIFIVAYVVPISFQTTGLVIFADMG